jgi:hypothetical protein
VSRRETTHGARCAGGQDRMMQRALGAAVECEVVRDDNVYGDNV